MIEVPKTWQVFVSLAEKRRKDVAEIFPTDSDKEKHQ